MSDEYYQELGSVIASRATAKGILQEEAYFEIASETLIEVGELSEANYTPYKKTGLQVDGYGGNLNDEEGTVKLILLDYSSDQNKPESLTNTDIQAIVKRGTNFMYKVLTKEFINEIEESSEVFNLAAMIRSNWKDVLKIRFILITNKQMSARVKAGGIKLAEVWETPITLNIWDYKRFADINAQGSEREPLIVRMDDFDKDIGILPADIENGRFPSYLAVVPGSVLADIYDIYSTRLLEQNVRVFLQAKGKINKGIQNTILDEPEMFFSYNNGLTATAENLEIEDTPSGQRIREIHNFQIVNGGQTMASIYQMSPYCKKKWKKGITPDISDIYVQMKLSVIPPECTLDIVPKISRFSNSQNKVSDADFFSNHPYHVEMEKFSRKVVAPSTESGWSTTKWYYERMRGQYNNDRNLKMKTEAQKREFENQYPSNQKFTKTDLAKYLTPWEGKPEVAQRGAAKCFTEFASIISEKWEKNPAFCNEMYYKVSIAKAIVFKQLEKIVSDQTWYAGGGTRAPIVLHTIGKLAYDLKKTGKSFPFLSVWNKQRLPTAAYATLRDLTTVVSEVILNPPTQGQLETEWAKQQLCTDALTKREFEYPSTFLDLMDSSEDYREDIRDAIKERKLDDSVGAQIFVMSQDAAFWRKLIEWGERRDLLKEKDISIVNVVITGKIPSEKQCEYIYGVYTKCKDAGFKAKPKELLLEE
jgi:hypothetical protein